MLTIEIWNHLAPNILQLQRHVHSSVKCPCAMQALQDRLAAPPAWPIYDVS